MSRQSELEKEIDSAIKQAIYNHNASHVTSIEIIVTYTMVVIDGVNLSVRSYITDQVLQA